MTAYGVSGRTTPLILKLSSTWTCVVSLTSWTNFPLSEERIPFAYWMEGWVDAIARSDFRGK